MTPARTDVELSVAPPPGPDDGAGGSLPAVASAPLTGGSMQPVPAQPSSGGEIDVVPLAAAGLAVAALTVLLRRTRRSDADR
jgi:hypothetical protein